MTDLIFPAAEDHGLAHTTPFGGQLAEVAAWTRANTDSPGMMSGLAEARLLEALIVVSGARQVLEIGSFTGLGTLTMAAALAPGGTVTTLERDPQAAGVAHRHYGESDYADRIELIVGDALETLRTLEGPFDLVYIDAWKADYPRYYDAVLPLLSERGVIVADNLFRGGAALDPAVTDPGTSGMREFATRVQADERVHNVLLTVGDGMMLIWRSAESG